MAALFVLFLFALVVAIHLWRTSRPVPVAPTLVQPPMKAAAPVPQGLYVDDGHAWARLTPDGVLRIGIDSFLAEAIADAQAIQLPPRGTELRRGDPLFRVKTHDRWLQIASPVDGEVVWTHDDLLSRPWSLTLDPYGVGWAVAMHSADLKGSLSRLRTGSQAVAFLRSELQKLVEFLTADTRVAGQPVLADGGVPPKGAASALSDKAWEEFCQRFVRPVRGDSEST